MGDGSPTQQIDRERPEAVAVVAQQEAGGQAEPVTTAVIAVAPPLRRFYAYRLLAEFELTGGIWILFLLDRGLSLGEIGLAEACFHLAPITLELPSGSLADVLGRKWSLAIGGLLVALSAALMLGAPALWLVLPAMYLGGASYAFRSGAQQAYLYDTLAETARTDRFTRVFGRLLSGAFVVMALATGFGAALAGGRVGDWFLWVAGFLPDGAVGELVARLGEWFTGQDFARSYGIMIGVGLVVAWLAAGLREPERHRSGHRSLIRTIGEAVRIVQSRPSLAALLGFTASLWTLLTLIGLYAQAVLKDRGLSTSAIGLAIAASLVCTAAGSWLAAALDLPRWFCRLDRGRHRGDRRRRARSGRWRTGHWLGNVPGCRVRVRIVRAVPRQPGQCRVSPPPSGRRSSRSMASSSR